MCFINLMCSSESIMVRLSSLRGVLKKVLVQMLSLLMNRVEFNYMRGHKILVLCRKILVWKQSRWTPNYMRMRSCMIQNYLYKLSPFKRKWPKLWVKGKECYFLNLRRIIKANNDNQLLTKDREMRKQRINRKFQSYD